MRSAAMVFAGALVLLGGGACTHVDPLTPPEPSVVNVRFEQVTAFETRALFTVRLSNENPFPLTVSGGSYDLSLNGTSVGKGLTGDEVLLPRLGTATVDVPVHVNHVALLLKAPSLLQSTRLSYEVASTVYVLDGNRTRRLKRQASGQFDLPVREQQTLQSLAAPRAMVPGALAPSP